MAKINLLLLLSSVLLRSILFDSLLGFFGAVPEFRGQSKGLSKVPMNRALRGYLLPHMVAPVSIVFILLPSDPYVLVQLVITVSAVALLAGPAND